MFEATRKHFVKPKLLYHNNIVFVLGGPGSGKGTQCAKLVEEFQLKHLSTGDLLRAEVEKGSTIGQQADQLMKEGKMVPTSLVIGLLRKAIEENIDATGFLIDGYPRAMDQAIEFENTIGPCRLALFFKCPLETLEARLLERGKTSGRADDNIDTIKKRFHTFQEQSLAVISYYRKQAKCVTISSEFPIEVVYRESRKQFFCSSFILHPNIILVTGDKGSGKTTQSRQLTTEFGYDILSVDEIFKKEESTVALIKPDAYSMNKKDDIIRRILDDGFEIIAEKELILSSDTAKDFYKEHKGKHFFENLVTWMSSSRIYAMVLRKENAIKDWRYLAGPTNSGNARETAPNTIRALYGTDGTHNAVHGSDSIASASREKDILFGHLFDNSMYKLSSLQLILKLKFELSRLTGSKGIVIGILF